MNITKSDLRIILMEKEKEISKLQSLIKAKDELLEEIDNDLSIAHEDDTWIEVARDRIKEAKNIREVE